MRIGDQNLEQFVAHVEPEPLWPAEWVRSYADRLDEAEREHEHVVARLQTTFDNGIVQVRLVNDPPAAREDDVDLEPLSRAIQAAGVTVAEMERRARELSVAVRNLADEAADWVPVSGDGDWVYRVSAFNPPHPPYFYMAPDGTLAPGADLYVDQDNYWGGTRWTHWWWLIGLAWWEGVRQAKGFAKRVWYWPDPVPVPVGWREVESPSAWVGDLSDWPADLAQAIQDELDGSFDYYASDPNQMGHGTDGGVPMSLAELLGADEEMDRIDRILEDE